jgi:hypothetical protein
MKVEVLNNHLKQADKQLYGTDYQEIADRAKLSKFHVQNILKGNEREVNPDRIKILHEARHQLIKKADRLQNQAKNCKEAVHGIDKLKDIKELA